MQDTQFYVEGYHVPVIARPDVCVIGGGAAGISAAVSAARCGLSVVLIEKQGYCGGATVAGLSGTICGLYSSGSQIEQIVFGFADEFHTRLKDRGGVDGPVKFGKTALVPHDGLIWKEVADGLLQHENIQVLYHSDFLKAFSDQYGTVTQLLVRGSGGQYVIEPTYVVDASGDAEVIDSIGGTTYMGNNGIVQTPTMIFKMGTVDMDAFLKMDPQEIDAAIIKADKAGLYSLPRHHVYIFPLPNHAEVLCNMTRITYPDGSTPLGISTADMTFAEIEGRKQAREYANFLKATFPAFSSAYMVDTGAQVGIRQTRSIVGKYQLKNDDVIGAVKNNGAVSHSAWPIEAHGAGELKIVYLENDYYAIPFETLIPSLGTNLLVAGRCMSAEHEALASARVTAQCFGMGYAVGAACALMRDGNYFSQDIKGSEVIQFMKEKGLKTSYEK